MHLHAGGGGAYGDPLDRDPKLVASDVAAGITSAAAAHAAYGVVIDNEGQLDEEATAARRQAIRDERLTWPLEGDVRVRRTQAAARLAEFDQWAQPMEQVQLVEQADPETGALLRVDVQVLQET